MRDPARQPLTIIMSLEWAFCHSIVVKCPKGDASSLFCKILPGAGTFRCLTLSYQRPLELGKRMPGRRAITGECDVRHFARNRIRSRSIIPITRASEGGHDARVMCEIPVELSGSARFSPNRRSSSSPSFC